MSVKKLFLILASIFPAICCAFYFMSDSPSLAQKALWFLSRAVMIAAPFVFFRFFSKQLSIKDFLAKCRKLSIKISLQSLLLGMLMATAIEIVFRLLPADLRHYGMGQIQKKILGLGLDSFDKFWIFALLLASLHSFLEEFYWRYFIFHAWIEERSSVASAHGLAAVAFALHHGLVASYFFGYQAGVPFAVGVAVGAWIWQLQLRYQNSFFGLWLCHLIVDFELMSIGWRSL